MPSASASASASAAAAPSQKGDSRLLRFTSHEAFRPRLILSLLSSRPVRIDRIRPDHQHPGLRDFEAGFLRLLEKCTNGTTVEIGYTGTSILFKPGTISGGAVTHDCGTSRPIGYFLEWLIPLAPFAKKEMALTFKGITTGQGDLGVDILRTVTLPTLQLFLPPSSSLASALELRILARGSAPLGGGSIFFRCPLLPTSGSGGSSGGGGLLRSLDFGAPGRIRKIRGVAAATRVSPQMANRMTDESRRILNRFIPDLYIFSDLYRGEEGGKSPGYSLSLLTTSTTGAIHSSSAVSRLPTEKNFDPEHNTPESIANQAVKILLQNLSLGGCIDRSHQSMVLLLMACGPEDVGRVLLGRLTPASIRMLRDIKDVLGVTFKIKEVEDDRKVKGGEEQDEDEDEDEEDEDEDENGMDLDQSEAASRGKFQPPRREQYMLTCLGAAIRGARRVG